MLQPSHVIRQLPRCCSSRISISISRIRTTSRLTARQETAFTRRFTTSYKKLLPSRGSVSQVSAPRLPVEYAGRSLFHSTARCNAGGTDYTSSSGISMDKYHEIADETMDEIFTKLEELAEDDKGLDVEFSAGVLTLDTQNGTYVINKQPPNKQIWLSSPISGPKRYDWIEEERQWVYSRDKSTLSGLLAEEVGIEWD
ncbi:Mitochondrial chaperone Frataxin [Orbilia oligospora]|uniref:ferroxidase n=1 Tax=Orbilia oligospora TaxID=2813651 RepID=A0A7C8JPS1_ORBOL|nr:Mitochondrial chaperone Frataxin [Orbilia oligospora]KAF3130286.1 Mitochondrial chaperone Frataxin [Orbilia oligospora]KAF3137424.1 Mitochondrial chaperone Frataxin [Orbilia oligospora]